MLDSRPFLDRAFDFEVHRRVVIERLSREVSEQRQQDLTFRPAITALASQLRTAAPFSERLAEDATSRRQRLEELRGAYRLAEAARNNASVPRVSFALAARNRRRRGGALLGAASLRRNAEAAEGGSAEGAAEGTEALGDAERGASPVSVPPFSLTAGTASAAGGGGGGSASGTGVIVGTGDGFAEAFPEIAEVREAVKQQFGGVGGALYADALLRHARAAEIKRQIAEQANRAASRGVSGHVAAYAPSLSERQARLSRAYEIAAARVRDEMLASLKAGGAAAASPLAALSAKGARRAVASVPAGVSAYVLERVRREALLQSATLALNAGNGATAEGTADGSPSASVEDHTALAAGGGQTVSGLVRARLGRRLASIRSSASLGFETRRALRLALAARVRKLQVTAAAAKAAIAAIQEEGGGTDDSSALVAVTGLDVAAEGDSAQGGSAVGPHSSCKARLTVVGHAVNPAAAAEAAAEVATPSASVSLGLFRQRATAWQYNWAVKQREFRHAKAAQEAADLARCTFRPQTLQVSAEEGGAAFPSTPRSHGALCSAPVPPRAGTPGVPRRVGSGAAGGCERRRL